MSSFFSNPTPYSQGKLFGMPNASKILASRLSMLPTAFIDLRLNTPLGGYALPTGRQLSISSLKVTAERVHEWMQTQYPIGRGYYYGGCIQDGSTTMDVYEYFDRMEDAVYMAGITGAKYLINIGYQTKMDIL
jgi:hypothetical protein